MESDKFAGLGFRFYGKSRGLLVRDSLVPRVFFFFSLMLTADSPGKQIELRVEYDKWTHYEG